MKTTLTSLLLGLFFLQLSACNESKNVKAVEKTIEFKAEGTLSISQPENNKTISFEIEIADNPYERQTGLMYRTNLDVDKGMLFIFDEEQILNFYMKNTPLALDLIFLNKQLEIVHIHKNAIPNDLTGISSVQPAQYVLEIQAGLSDLHLLQKGNQIDYKSF
jgi:uncharacterized membrane protein (UPF0127 family)